MIRTTLPQAKQVPMSMQNTGFKCCAEVIDFRRYPDVRYWRASKSWMEQLDCPLLAGCSGSQSRPEVPLTVGEPDS
jgi:hypothetical protein